MSGGFNKRCLVKANSKNLQYLTKGAVFVLVAAFLWSLANFAEPARAEEKIPIVSSSWAQRRLVQPQRLSPGHHLQKGAQPWCVGFLGHVVHDYPFTCPSGRRLRRVHARLDGIGGNLGDLTTSGEGTCKKRTLFRIMYYSLAS